MCTNKHPITRLVKATSKATPRLAVVFIVRVAHSPILIRDCQQLLMYVAGLGGVLRRRGVSSWLANVRAGKLFTR